jgi:erythromycin esterase
MHGHLLALFLFLSLTPQRARSQTPASAHDTAFVQWAKSAARPLELLALPETKGNLDALQRVIRGARVVGLGESQHSMQELLVARYALLRLLVSRFGFTGIAMETGLPEARRVDDWVTGATTAEPKFAKELGYGFGEDLETVTMLRWLQRYNARLPRERRVHFYGVDVPQNGGGSVLPALEPVWAFLQKVDSAFAAGHRTRLAPIAQRLASDGWWNVPAHYDSLGLTSRDALRRGIEELNDRFRRHQTDYVRRSSADEFSWAQHLAVVARQTEALLRAGAISPNDPRDSAMAANTRWVMERERRRGGVVLLAHNLHVGAERGMGPYYTARLKELGYRGSPEPLDRTGQLLREQLGQRYVTIATAFLVSAADSMSRLSDPTSVDGLLSTVGPRAFFLDLRNAPHAGAASWLDGVHKMRAEGSYVDIIPRRSFDALIFVDRIRPAVKSP